MTTPPRESGRPLLSILLLCAATVAATVVLDVSGKALQVRPELGLVVEKVPASSVAETAGIQEGDILLAWERPAVRGDPAARGGGRPGPHHGRPDRRAG